MYPYLAGSSYILQLLPPEALEGGLPALMARLADSQTRESLRRAVEETNPDPHAPKSKVAMIGWGNVRISGTSNPALKSLEGKDMQAAANEAGITPFDLMVRLILEDGGQTTIVLFQLDTADLRAACTHPLAHGRFRRPAPPRNKAPSARLWHLSAGRGPAQARGLVFAGRRGAADDVRGGGTLRAGGPGRDTARAWPPTWFCSTTPLTTTPHSIHQPCCPRACSMSGWRDRPLSKMVKAPAGSPDGCWAKK